MKDFQTKSKPSHVIIFLVIYGVFCITLFLGSLFLFPEFTSNIVSSPMLQTSPSSTSLEHIFFGIASSQRTLLHRKEYLKLWWKPNITRGCVFLDTMPPDTTTPSNDSISFPPLCISKNTSQSHHKGKEKYLRPAIRIAHVVSETIAMGDSNVRWFVFGDDDTVFFQENLVKTLSKYDHELWYYIGTNSESVTSNGLFSYNMAYGGGGFAISYSLGRVLAKVLDSCLERYVRLPSSDAMIYSCMTELGVSMTHEPGFHQMDVNGNILGLLAAHPIRPLISLHHLDRIYPIFPKMRKTESLKQLFDSASIDSQRILQQTVCYSPRYSWTISISWGYVVMVFESHISMSKATRIQETHRPFGWRDGSTDEILDKDTSNPDPCLGPVVFFMDEVSSTSDEITSIYKIITPDNCTFDMASPRNLQEIRVHSQKLDQTIEQLKAPRRQCCDVLHDSHVDGSIEVGIRPCGKEELIYAQHTRQKKKFFLPYHPKLFNRRDSCFSRN